MTTPTHHSGEVVLVLAAAEPVRRAGRRARSALAALGATVALCAAPLAAHAADLGTDCCADLEERIAEFEDTAARKGNREVSLKVSGQVNQAILVWDDGFERNAYQVMNSNSTDRFRFEGRAKISKDLEAGYYLEIGARTASASGVDQRSDESGGNSLRVRNSVWYLRSEALGAVSVGLAAAATDDVLSYNLGGTNVAGSADVAGVGGGFFTRDSGGGLNSLNSGNTMSLRWRRFAADVETPNAQLVRYDSPVFKGFAASAAWGRDDFWDIAVRYASNGKLFRVAAGIGYYENRTEDEDTFGWPPGGDNEPNNGGTVVREYKGSASIMHVPTGIFVSGAYLHREFSGIDPGGTTFACFTSPDALSVQAAGIPCTNRPDFDYYWLNAGIRRNVFDLGWTSIYGEYARSMDAVTGLNVSVASADGGDIDYVTSSTMQMWGFGIVQHISAAQMDLYLSYRRYSADVSGIEADGTPVVAPIDDIDLIMAGSRIRF